MHFSAFCMFLLECIEPFNTVQCILDAPIVLLESIDLILAHYASITGLPNMLQIMLAYIFKFWPKPIYDNYDCGRKCTVTASPFNVRFFSKNVRKKGRD